MSADDAQSLRIIAVCGSLRAASKNRALLEAAQLVAPGGVEIAIDWSLATLPHYNPDLDTLDGSSLPPAAVAWRATIASADGLLISSPEYAHGIPGVLKNALDWLVSSTDFPGMPVAVLGASVLSVIAPAQLREILVTMNANFVDEASIVVPVPGASATAEIIAADPELSGLLLEALAALVRAIDARD
ncbi:MAG TPA: NADPH-dependent FMN reductase [Gemmatimonadaceae bacterium]|nr:NADPH-dependent FMN reductase [Gemmatimonadaceae bacterium]